MTANEKLQVKKDTWWGIRESKMTIACLERQVNASFDAMKAIVAVWEKGQLRTVGANLVLYKSTDPIPQTLEGYANPADLAALVEELEAEKKKLESLENSFNRM